LVAAIRVVFVRLLDLCMWLVVTTTERNGELLHRSVDLGVVQLDGSCALLRIVDVGGGPLDFASLRRRLLVWA
jgi:hypothetical protein